MTMRLTATLALAILVLGCGMGTPVTLLTGTPNGMGDGCFLSNHVVGRLVDDRQYGTALDMATDGGSNPVPVMWRPGFTAQRVGSKVEVRNPDGTVIATTGRRYDIAGGYAGQNPLAFWACDFVTELP